MGKNFIKSFRRFCIFVFGYSVKIGKAELVKIFVIGLWYFICTLSVNCPKSTKIFVFCFCCMHILCLSEIFSANITKLEKMLCFNWKFFSTSTHTLKSFNSTDSVVLSYCVAVPLLYYIFWFLSLFLTDFYYTLPFFILYILQFSKSKKAVNLQKTS